MTNFRAKIRSLLVTFMLCIPIVAQADPVVIAQLDRCLGEEFEARWQSLAARSGDPDRCASESDCQTFLEAEAQRTTINNCRVAAADHCFFRPESKACLSALDRRWTPLFEQVRMQALAQWADMDQRAVNGFLRGRIERTDMFAVEPASGCLESREFGEDSEVRAFACEVVALLVSLQSVEWVLVELQSAEAGQ